ncbi:hypothetical protein IBX73_11410 [candidate division WOR-3 bacterium]|nr:hypothetical protein [candidate division WOR-3 bacterium]
MFLISEAVSKDAVLQTYNTYFKTMIKAVVDVHRELIAIDAELHADLESMLLHEGSEQENLWGINLFLGKDKEDWIEFTALINIRPSMDNRTMEVEDPKIRQKITEVVGRLITE